MPFPVVAIVGAVARGAIARGAAGAIARGAAQGAMTTARFGLKGKGGLGMAVNAAKLGSLSSSQFSGTNPSVNITGPAVHEMLGKTPQ